jgi:Cu(I)/Ag(I) efflux system membrane fusion protein
MKQFLIKVWNKGKIVGIILLIVIAFLIGYIIKSAQPLPTQIKKEDKQPQMWTCSMHPQIKLPKPGQCPICFMNLVPVSKRIVDREHPRRLVISEQAKVLAGIKTAPVCRKDVKKTIFITGKVTYDETKIAHITAWVAGRIDRLYVNFTGGKVKKGEPMLYLYSPQLFSAQQEYLQALKLVKELKSASDEQSKEMALATLNSAREKLRLYGVAEQELGEIKRRGTPSDHITIRAPISGTVIYKNGFEGMYVKEGTRIYTIADLSYVWVILDVYESDLIWIGLGQEVEIQVEAYPGKIFRGRIVFIDPFLNEKTRTVGIRVEVPNPDGQLKPGMFVHAQIKVNIPDKLVIPISAPLITGKRAVVYVEVPDAEIPTYEGRVIQLGPRAEEHFIVKSGLKEGELVVVEGNFKIDSQLQIQAKPSMMTVQEEVFITYECECTGKRWQQPAGEKKRCPYCGEAMPDCGRPVD